MGKTLLLDSQFYHVFNKTIGDHNVFESNHIKQRFCDSLSFYNGTFQGTSFSAYLRNPHRLPLAPILSYGPCTLLKILAYCVMPNHYHLLVRVSDRKRLSSYIQNVENSFSRYTNLVSNRRGPLWQSRYKHVLVKTHAQLVHVSRYIHLNPTTSSLVKNPEDWLYSSYRDYIKSHSVLYESWNDITFRSPNAYRRFVEDRKDYQKKLKRIKKHLI